MKNKNLPIIVVVLGLLLLIPTFFMGGEPKPPVMPKELVGVFIDSPAVQLPDFTFVDHNEQEFKKENFLGKWSLVFFGYTNCPDVCPTSLSILDKVARDKNTPDDVQYIFASVDPKRDTPKILKEYVDYFNEKFIGVTGESEELNKFKEPLGVIYDYEGDTNSDDYIVNHFAAIYIIDPSGKQRAYILPPHKVSQVGKAFRLIYDHYN